MQRNINKRITGIKAKILSAGLCLATFTLSAATPLLHFGLNEGAGTNITDSVNSLVGVLGIPLNAANDLAVVKSTPSGLDTDLAVGLNVGSTNSQGCLVVDDRVSPILTLASNAFTMEAWINRDTASNRTYEGLAAYGRSYKMGFNKGQFHFTLYGIVDVFSGIYPTVGEWHHVATVFEPGVGVTFFLDGVSVTNVAEIRLPRAFQNNFLTIGAENVNSNAMVNTFQGAIDRFRIHKAALTIDQLDSVANTPKATLTDTLVAYDFNGGFAPYASTAATDRPALPSNQFLQQSTVPKWTTDAPSTLAGDFALKFTGLNQQVVVSDPNTAIKLDSTNASFTMQTWIKFEGNPKTRQVFFYNNGPGGAVSFSVFTNRSMFVTTLGVKDQSSLAIIPDDGKWHHIAVVHEDKKEFRFYIDKVLADTQVYTGSVIFTRTNKVAYLGSEPAGGYQFYGSIDRLRLSSGMLTPDQFDARSGAPAPVLNFSFDAGNGSALSDSVSSLAGSFGIVLNPANDPTTGANGPSGLDKDLAIGLNVGNTNSQGCLVVDDRVNPILTLASNAFTMEAWINRDATSVRTYEGLAAYGRSYKMGFNKGQFHFTLYGIVDVFSGIYPTVGEWHHVATVFEPGVGVTFYLDGVSVTNVVEIRLPRAFQNNLLTIGAENVNSNAMVNAFQGAVDRFRIHKAALTADQLDSIANTPKAILSDTLVAYNFNENAAPYPNEAATVRPAITSNQYLQRTTSPTWITDTPSTLTGDFALNFTGLNQQIVMSDPNTLFQLDPANPSFTMQTWIKFSGNPKTRQVFFYNNGPGGAVSFSVFTNRSLFVTTLGVKDQSSQAIVPDDGKWHHIAVVHENKKEFRFYIDAVLADTQAYAGSVIFSRTNKVFYLGSEPAGGYQFIGAIDRLKLSTGMLTPAQFDYPSGAPSLPEPTVNLARTDNGIVITFTGTLQSANFVGGAWTDVNGSSPLLVVPNEAMKFYRARQ